MDIPRKDWLRALTAHPAPTLNALADQLAADGEVTFTRLPQAGLGLLTLTDGAFHEPYYLGEFPLSACHIELVFPNGCRAEGGAQVLADDVELARSLAILDAILAARLPGWKQLAKYVQSGAAQLREEDHRRRAVLAATRVDFALLGNAGEGNDED
jgi:alpha-D-ribose 1-methylphosphonate 5-triphosphate synthase subunit PhnG